VSAAAEAVDRANSACCCSEHRCLAILVARLDSRWLGFDVICYVYLWCSCRSGLIGSLMCSAYTELLCYVFVGDPQGFQTFQTYDRLPSRGLSAVSIGHHHNRLTVHCLLALARVCKVGASGSDKLFGCVVRLKHLFTGSTRAVFWKTNSG